MRKFAKKVVCFALTSIVTVSSAFGTVPFTKQVDTKITAYAAQTSTYTVNFTAPTDEDWTGTTVYAYAYYDVTTNGKTTTEKPLGPWPGTPATKNADGTYSANVTTTTGSAKVIFASIDGPLREQSQDADGNIYYECTKKAQLPSGWELDADGNPVQDEHGNYIPVDGYTISSNAWIVDGKVSTTNPNQTAAPTATPTQKPTTAPTATPTTVPTVAPTAVPTVEPVSGPQVYVNKENGTSFYEENGDYMTVELRPVAGATSITYSVDNGPAKTATGTTQVKIGEGKIANSPITLKVTSTNGTVTNTQTFNYFKKTKALDASAAASKKTTVAKSMVSLFSTVKTAAVSQTRKLKVHFNLPTTDRDKWTGNDVHIYCYAYYDETINGKTTTQKPFGAWPGTEMSKDSDGSYYQEVTTSVPYAKVMFVSVKGGKGSYTYNNQGEDYYACDELAKLPYGWVTDSEGNEITDGYGNWIPVDGYIVTSETWFTGGSITSTATATPTVTATPSVTPTSEVTATPTAQPATLDGYFGASLSAPQLNTTAQTLSAVAVNAVGDVTYKFTVDGKEIYSGKNNSVAWDTSSLTAGTHVIAAEISDKNNTWADQKVYTIETPVVEPTATAEVTATPSAVPTAEVTATPTVAPTAEVTVAPTTVPTAEVTATPTVAPTSTPDIVIIPDPTAVPNNPVLAVSFDKAGKSLGETVKVKAKLTNYKSAYTYTYVVYKGSKKVKTLASKTKKNAVNWTPTKTGTYKVKVTAYNQKKKAITTTTKKYTVKKRIITIKKFKFNKKTIKAKKTLTITVKATATKGKPQYKIVVKNSKGKTVATKSYSKKTVKKWKTTKKGTYKITLYVKNGKGVVVSKTKTYKVK